MGLTDINWPRWRLAAIGGTIVLIVLMTALFAPLIAPAGPLDLDVSQMLAPPSGAHLLGADELGRDVLSRTIYATRVSVRVAFTAAAMGLVIGTLIGVVAAYFGGWIDLILMRLMEVLFSFPAILLAVVLMAALGTSVFNAMLAIGIIFIPGFSRLARAATQAVMRQQYVEAAQAIGMSHARILRREILPNIIAPLLVEGAAAFSYAILLESMLSFLGLGVQPPDPSWAI